MMNYILVEIEIDGNGVRDKETPRAISTDKSKLKMYCLNTYNVPVGKPDVFSWDNYFVIKESKINIII